MLCPILGGVWSLGRSQAIVKPFFYLPAKFFPALHGDAWNNVRVEEKHTEQPTILIVGLIHQLQAMVCCLKMRLLAYWKLAS